MSAQSTMQTPSPKDALKLPAADETIAKAARYTLLSMTKHRSIGQLALRYVHEGRSNTDAIAYATGAKCVYGPAFAHMDRFSQTFVVGHETLHHVLGHIPRGALLYQREKSEFSWLIWNIACDACINWILDRLPDVDVLSERIRYGVRKCQELGIVNWSDIQAEVAEMVAQGKVQPNPIFEKTPDQLCAEDIYYALRAVIRQAAETKKPDEAASEDAPPSPSGSQSDEPQQQNSGNSGGGDQPDETGEENLTRQFAEKVNAHDDLSDAIKEAATQSEHELRDTVNRAENILRQAQADANSQDAILNARSSSRDTQTPWPQAMRHMATSALIRQPSVNHGIPSRRVVSQIAMACDPRTPAAMRPKAIGFEPRTMFRREAKRCFLIIDTSASMLTDKKLLTNCLREAKAICSRVDTDLSVIFADADVCSITHVEDAHDRLKTLKPTGGGSTDFRPAIELAESHKPDLIVYLTDLMGRFPDRKPNTPIIWGFPPEYASIATPYGKRLQLVS